nr:transposase [Streptomyces pseudovenezuelae]
MAAGHSVDPARRQEAFEGPMSRIAGRFTRVESRRRARKLVLGLLSDLPRKNCWTIAEWAGDKTPDGMQHLLGRAKWDADQVRDDVRAYKRSSSSGQATGYVVDEVNIHRRALPSRHRESMPRASPHLRPGLWPPYSAHVNIGTCRYAEVKGSQR